MSLARGTRFNTYLIGESIGVGGMGEVYRATDTNLKRDVALKVLPESFANDAERLARFQREAELLAALNHPNIAQIFGLEKADGVTALVMELIDGPTLAERIEQGPLPADDALNIALQIADALEAAHERQIVHRDLKPANIKLKLDGRVKVLDFGIAKAVDPGLHASGPVSPHMTTPAMTQSGMILGTAAYMSPEQARGKPVDRRADIWAFGCVLFEMLSGQPAFGAEDVPLTLARVLSQPTDMRSLPKDTAPALRNTIELCLEKDLKKRLADFNDVRLALRGSIGKGTTTLATMAAPQTLARRILPLAGALVFGALMASIAFSLWQQPAPQPVNRFTYAVPSGTSFRNTGRNVFALAPDGRHFVFNTTEGLMLRDLSTLTARVIPGTEEILSNPFFAPDSSSVAYYAFENRQIKRMNLEGGAPVLVATIDENPFGASWASDNNIYYGQPSGIYRVSANGGTPGLLIANQEGENLAAPELLPDGDTLLFTSTRSGWDQASIVAQSLSTGARTVVVQIGADAHYLASGHLVYAVGADLFAVAFDASTLAVGGGAVPVAQGVARAILTGSSNYDVAADGTLVYLNGTVQDQRRNLLWVARDGTETVIPIEARNYSKPLLAPDGSRVVLNEDPQDDLWVWDFASETAVLLTLDGQGGDFPVWSADGTHIAYGSRGRTIDSKAANNIGASETLATTETLSDSTVSFTPEPNFMSPSGEQLVFRMLANSSGYDLALATFGADPHVEWLLQAQDTQRNAALSPDGRWMAYESLESGVYEIYVRPFPNVDADLVQVSSGGGRNAVWSRDGTELFYLVGDTNAATNMMVANVDTTGPDFKFSGRTILMPWPYATSDGRAFDVSLDGQQFLGLRNDILTEASDATAEVFVIAQNWTEELKRLVPVDGP